MDQSKSSIANFINTGSISLSNINPLAFIGSAAEKGILLLIGPGHCFAKQRHRPGRNNPSLIISKTANTEHLLGKMKTQTAAC